MASSSPTGNAQQPADKKTILWARLFSFVVAGELDLLTRYLNRRVFTVARTSAFEPGPESHRSDGSKLLRENAFLRKEAGRVRSGGAVSPSGPRARLKTHSTLPKSLIQRGYDELTSE